MGEKIEQPSIASDQPLDVKIDTSGLKEELKLTVKEMLEDALLGNPQYKEACNDAKEAGKIKADVKRQILEEEKLLGLSNKVKDLGLRLKETKEALSEYLVEYAKLSGSNQIEGDDGQTREIVYSARLVKAANFPK